MFSTQKAAPLSCSFRPLPRRPQGPSAAFTSRSPPGPRGPALRERPLPLLQGVLPGGDSGRTPTPGGLRRAGAMRYGPGSSHSSRLTAFSVRRASDKLKGWFCKKNARGSFLWSSYNCAWQTEGQPLGRFPGLVARPGALGQEPGLRWPLICQIQPAPVEVGWRGEEWRETYRACWEWAPLLEPYVGLNKHISTDSPSY